MTRRTHLPYDVARCNGHKVDDKVVVPCNTCARREFRHQVGGAAALDSDRPVRGLCSQYINIEYDDN